MLLKPPSIKARTLQSLRLRIASHDPSGLAHMVWNVLHLVGDVVTFGASMVTVVLSITLCTVANRPKSATVITLRLSGDQHA